MQLLEAQCRGENRVFTRPVTIYGATNIEHGEWKPDPCCHPCESSSSEPSSSSESSSSSLGFAALGTPLTPYQAAVQSFWDVDAPANSLVWFPDPDEESLPDGYRIYRRAAHEAGPRLVATVGLTYAYTDATAEPGVVYEYTLVGFRGRVESDPVSLAIRTANGQEHSETIS